MKKYNFLKTKKIQFKPNNLFTFSLGTAFLISQPITNVLADSFDLTVNGITYSLQRSTYETYDAILSASQSAPWWDSYSTASSFASAYSSLGHSTSFTGIAFDISSVSNNLFLFYTSSGSVKSSFALPHSNGLGFSTVYN